MENIKEKEYIHICTAENCNEIAIADYNECGDWACAYHLKKWNDYFEEEYN